MVMENSLAGERKMQPKKQKSLSEVLQEQQERLVFPRKRREAWNKRGGCLAKSYKLAGQQYEYQLSSSPLRSPLKLKTPATTLREAAARILEPRVHSCSRPRPTAVRYLVHLDRMANIKKSKGLRKAWKKSQLEYADEQLNSSSWMASGEGKKTSNAWHKAAGALLNAFGGSSRLFRFNKDRRETGGGGQKNNTYNLIKSILRKVAPSKERISIKDGSASGGFSNAMRTLSNGNNRAEVQGSEEARLRIYDIVRWNSFEESEFLYMYAGHSRTSLVREKESRADVNSSTSMETQKRNANVSVDDWLEDFFFSSSSSAWLESSLDSDRESNSTSRSSSSDCSELKGIIPDPCNLEESHFSLEIDQNVGAGDFHHTPRSAVNMISTKPQVCDAACNRYEGSVTCIQKDYMRASSASITSPLTFMPEIDEVTSADDVKSNSTDIEENRCAPYMNKRFSERGSKVNRENDNSEEEVEMEQQSPISVLDSPFEVTSGFEQSLATIQRASKQLLKKICEYEQLAQMHPFVLQRKMCTWEEVDTTITGHTDKLVEMELKSGTEEWKRFPVEREEIGMKIEVAIFRVLLEELLLDLLPF